MLSISRLPPRSQSLLFLYTTLFRSGLGKTRSRLSGLFADRTVDPALFEEIETALLASDAVSISSNNAGSTVRSADRKSTRLNSSHSSISYAVFCLKKKKQQQHDEPS